MTDDNQDNNDRTVIRPGLRNPASAAPPAAPVAPAAPPAAAQDTDDRTRFEPMPAAQSPAPPPHATPPRAGGNRQIAIGDILNGTFEVKRFIARGGMGEVYEGTNVHTDEKLAIKVILPHLADDPNVQDLFRNEARTLQKLSHPALVRYVLLSKEMQFGVFYIVTEYIGGSNLSDVLGQLNPTPDDLIALTRRLAEGLGAAHALGAIHRDMAPDNVILQNGDIRQARIIDFGIAKDLNPGSHTIIGDGFGGKLGFVAPEQLGDFDRQVGPWSDVYSLGLMILSVAQGQKVDMGSSFVEAMNRRRKGVDTSAAPPEIRDVLDRMLIADPQLRLRSMDEVLAALNGTGKATGAPGSIKAPPPAKPAKEPKKPVVKATSAASLPGSASAGTGGIASNKPLLIGGGAALLALVAGGLYFALGTSTPDPAAQSGTPVAGGAGVETAVRTAVTRALPNIACGWLDLTGVKANGDGVSLAFSGVAGRTAEAEAEISKIVSGAGTHISATDFGDVAPIPAPECDTIDAVRQIRATPGVQHMTSAQRRYTMSTLTSGEYSGQSGASAIVELNLGPDVRDFALYGVEPSGEISEIINSRAQFDAIPKGQDSQISDLGNHQYRLRLDSNHSGWSGLVMLTGDGNFAQSMLKGKAGERPADWKQRFATAAAQGNWKAEMVWYNIVSQ